MSNVNRFVIGLSDVEAAAARIAGLVHQTPVLESQILDEMTGAKLFFKCENLQRTGAFKARGACNAVLCLEDSQVAQGVLTHSSGNHGAAVALAAARRGCPAFVVMPSNSNSVKVAAVRHYGAQVIFCEPTQEARETAAAQCQERTGATLVHPFDDPMVMAGQGTAALELMAQVQDLDIVMTPVGGGGMLSGSAIAVSEQAGRTRIFGAEPKNADDTIRSLEAGVITPTPIDTIADGLRTMVGELTFPIIQDRVERVLPVSEEGIVAAMRLVWSRMKIIIEPSSAVAVAAVIEHPESFKGQRVALIITGGNVDLDALPW